MPHLRQIFQFYTSDIILQSVTLFVFDYRSQNAHVLTWKKKKEKKTSVDLAMENKKCLCVSRSS